MRKYRCWMIVACLTGFAVADAAAENPFTQDWNNIRIRETTEDRLVFLFGIPDVVTVEMDWREWDANRGVPMHLSTLPRTLRYIGVRQDLPLLRGPLGRAGSVEVYVKAGKVERVDWHYSGSWAEGAREAFLAWRDANVKEAGLMLVGTKRFPNGDVMVLTPAKALSESELDVSLTHEFGKQ